MRRNAIECLRGVRLEDLRGHGALVPVERREGRLGLGCLRLGRGRRGLLLWRRHLGRRRRRRAARREDERDERDERRRAARQALAGSGCPGISS